MSHGKTICEKCSKVIVQCRCMESHNNITYSTCEECLKEINERPVNNNPLQE